MQNIYNVSLADSLERICQYGKCCQQPRHIILNRTKTKESGIMLNSVDREYFQFVDNFCYYILLGTILSELWCVSPIMLYPWLWRRWPPSPCWHSDEWWERRHVRVSCGHGSWSPVVSAGSGWTLDARRPCIGRTRTPQAIAYARPTMYLEPELESAGTISDCRRLLEETTIH